MSIFKEESAKYKSILDRMKISFDTFKFATVEEKSMVMELLEKKIKELNHSDAYVSSCDYSKNDDQDWKDPRL